MKRAYLIAMLLPIFFQVVMKPAVMLRWKLDQEAITARFCENRDKPMLHCDGQCYLAKQLRKLEAEEQKERAKYPFPSQKLKHAEADLACPELTIYSFAALPDVPDRSPYPATDIHYLFDFNERCFHPPQSC